MLKGFQAGILSLANKTETIGKKHRAFFPVIIGLLIFVIYLSINIGVTGPQYLSDEVSYLDKASTIAGSVVHASTSWYAGYPLLLSPAFFLFSNPFVEWKAVLVINALLWAGSAALLYFMLRRLHPKKRTSIIAIVTLASFAYPAFSTMSGYAFATSGFVFFFMASLAALMKSGFKRPGWLVLAVMLGGYLYWIHPIGAIFVGLLLLLLVAKAAVAKRLSYAVYGILLIIIAATYQLLVQPAVDAAMSAGGGAVDTHYLSTLHTIFSTIATPQFFLNLLVLLVGLVLYVCIATFGIAVYAAIPYLKECFRGRSAWKSLLEDPVRATVALIITSVIGVILVAAIATAGTSPIRADQWIYGRYTEMYLLPLIGIGLLSAWKFRTGLYIALATVLGGFLLTHFTNPVNSALNSINEVNIQGFWPLIFLRHAQANYLFWFCLGAIGILAIGFLGSPKRKIGLLVLAPLLALTFIVNMGWHQGLLATYSAPSGLYKTITSNYSPDTCIGYTTGTDVDERLSLYSYYLHNYDLRPMTYQTWLESDCSGPYLTFTLSPSTEDVEIIGKETQSGLYMVVKKDDASKVTFQDPSSSFTLRPFSKV